MENYENKNFDGNGQFPNLDDAFQALNKGHCYNACAALKMNKNNCIDNRDKIIQKLINAVQYYFDEIMNYFAQKKVFYQEKVTCRVYWQSDYDCGKNIGYLNETLYFYGMHSKEQLVLENILKDGLEQFVDQFPNEYILTTIADLIYDSDFSFPEKFVGLLSEWKRLKYKWEENGFNKQHIWQQLIDVWNTAMGHGPYAYAVRSFGLVVATIVFWGLVIPVFLTIVKGEGKLSDLSSWKKTYHYTFGGIGVLRKQLRNYIDYFRPNFHPWDHENRQYMQQMEQLIYQLAEKK
jgi:hypothetical protein